MYEGDRLLLTPSPCAGFLFGPASQDTIKITSRFQPEKYDAWQIKRRYSDFHQLHRNLLKATDNAKVLQLAPKRFVKNNLAEEFLNKRQSMLNLYLDALLGVGVLVKHPLTLKFVDA